MASPVAGFTTVLVSPDPATASPPIQWVDTGGVDVLMDPP